MSNSNSSEKRLKIGFFRAWFGVCRGTEIFNQLRKNSGWRVCFHLVFLSILCALGINLGILHQINPIWQEMEQGFFDKFGKTVYYTSDGIRPEKEPDKAKTLSLPLEGKLYYAPNGLKELNLGQDLELQNYFFIWSPGYEVLCRRFTKNTWLVTLVNSGDIINRFEVLPTSVQKHRLDQAGMIRFIENIKDSELPLQTEDSSIFNVEEFFQEAYWALKYSIFMFMFIVLILVALFFTILFTIMFWITSLRRLRVLRSVREFWKVGVYAGFPAMMVASCFPGLDLPYLSYGTVYMIGLIIYWMIAVARIERDGMESQPGGEEQS